MSKSRRIQDKRRRRTRNKRLGGRRTRRLSLSRRRTRQTRNRGGAGKNEKSKVKSQKLTKDQKKMLKELKENEGDIPILQSRVAPSNERDAKRKAAYLKAWLNKLRTQDDSTIATLNPLSRHEPSELVGHSQKTAPTIKED